MFTTMSVQLPTHILLDQKQLSTTMDPGSPRWLPMEMPVPAGGHCIALADLRRA